MGLPFGKPVVSPILIGRAAQLELLERAVDGIVNGRGETFLIAGEAGIGKSRLIAETREYATRRGLQVLEGHCFEQDLSLPYAPLLDLLRARFAGRSAEEMKQELGASALELAKLLPELIVLQPGLVPTPALAPEQEQRRLVHALIQFVTTLAAAQPMVVVIEDLH